LRRLTGLEVQENQARRLVNGGAYLAGPKTASSL
jgi:hypothetical protein